MTRISGSLRREVQQRAKGYCEYCLLHESDAYFQHEPDHIIAVKHGGQSISLNLAWSCFDCNRFKGPDIGSIDPDTNRLVPLFHPRQQNWTEHFALEDGVVKPLTANGRVTVRLLQINLPNRIEVRRILSRHRRPPR